MQGTEAAQLKPLFFVRDNCVMNRKTNPLIVALNQALNAEQALTGVIQLCPAGKFRSMDGRPAECDSWFIDETIATKLINQIAQRQTPLVIDYEHQTFRSVSNGNPAPAAGWIQSLSFNEKGLFATVEFTARATKYIKDGEYRFISPVFTYEKTGEIRQLLHAALTNVPALDGLDEVMLAAANLLSINNTTPDTTVETTTESDTTEEDTMNEELLERLRWMLNLPISATAEEIMAELDKLKKMIAENESVDVAAANIDVVGLLGNRYQNIAALTAQVETPDPTKFVSVEVMNQAIAEAREQAVALNTTHIVDGLVTAALSDGRLLPAQETWARSLGAKDPDALKTFVESASPIAALTQQQTVVNKPKQSETHQSFTDEVDESTLTAVCNLMGTDPNLVLSEVKNG